MESVNKDSITLIEHDQWVRNQAYNDELLAPVFQLLEQVKDPEIPSLSIWDMGILRSVNISAVTDLQGMKELPSSIQNQRITVVITPTYSGCPAMDLIHEDIHQVLNSAGFRYVDVKTQLSPAWSTTWMSADAKVRMAKSGIAPPEVGSCGSEDVTPQCPQCGSKHTHIISQFSSTACKALYRCESCLEPFDYFKAF